MSTEAQQEAERRWPLDGDDPETIFALRREYVAGFEAGQGSRAPQPTEDEPLNGEREQAAAERYPDIEADPPGTRVDEAEFPTGWSRRSEREAFVSGAEWAAGFRRAPAEPAVTKRSLVDARKVVQAVLEEPLTQGIPSDVKAAQIVMALDAKEDR